MPKALHDKLQREAEGKIKTPGKYKSVKEHQQAYVYGTLNKLKKQGAF